jgi:FAD/FMN-containing dehydrogenase
MLPPRFHREAKMAIDLQQALALAKEFKGRIQSVHASHAEFVGRPAVLIPRRKDMEDVGRALRLATAAGKRVFVRSGRRVSSTDVSHADGAVVSMERFDHVEPAGATVVVGAAASVGELAAALADTDLFLPLGDNPSRSVVSAVLSKGKTPAFPRSGVRSAPLCDGVVGATVVRTDDDAPNVETIDAKGFRSLQSGRKRAVVAEVTLDGAHWAAGAEGRWLLARSCCYDAPTFATVCERLLSAGQVPGKVDLSVRVTSAALGMRLVIVRATGQGADLRSRTEELVDSVLRECACHVLDARHVEGAGATVRGWVAAGPGDVRDGEVHARFGSTGPAPFEGDFRQAFLTAVELAVGVDADGIEHAPGVQAWAELRLAVRGGVDARAHVDQGTGEVEVFDEVRRVWARALPAFDAAETARRVPAAREALRGRAVLTAAAPVPAFRLEAPPRDDDLDFPDEFDGQVIPPDTDAYAEATGDVAQYARSSYDDATVQHRMQPHLVVVPDGARDVELAVRYAAANGLRVVARSGGHQYCGLSSGGDDTLLIDMASFSATPRFHYESGPEPTAVTVQPGVALEDLSRALLTGKVVIPHGECPLVNIGGHVQTGGVGHQLRSFGLALDHVRQFKMVTCVPHSQPRIYRERTFRRPTSPRPDVGDPVSNDDVFRAVLGGAPGSWGVLTEITFDVRADRRSPGHKAYGRSEAYLYQRESFAGALEQFRLWVERAAAGAPDALPNELDLFLTVLSSDWGWDVVYRPTTLLVETMALDAGHVPEIDRVFQGVRDALFSLNPARLPLVQLVRGHVGASVIADAGVRKIGSFRMRKSGREFDLPYKKALYVTNVPISEAFCRGFVDLVDDVEQADGVHVVFQAVVGRGTVVNRGHGTTSMQRREALAQLVFDVFYEEGHEDDAVGFQQRMRGLLPDFSEGADLRMFWGSFEDHGEQGQLVLSEPEVQRLYFDDDQVYPRLQEVKRYTDPGDVFKTSFTVPI